jgi:hypothetical protein
LKFAAKNLLPLIALAVTSAVAQNNNIKQVQHVIVVIEENRTSTNLFHEEAPLVANGAHVIPHNNQGPCGANSSSPPNGTTCTTATQGTITLTGLPLECPFDPDHSHDPAWYCTYNGGKIDGACHIKQNPINGFGGAGCPGNVLQYCPCTYVDNTPIECTPLPSPASSTRTFTSPNSTASRTGCFKPTRDQARRRIYSSFLEPRPRTTSTTEAATAAARIPTAGTGLPQRTLKHRPPDVQLLLALSSGNCLLASSANHLLLLSRMEYRTRVVFLMQDDSTRRVYRLYDFTKSQTITSDHHYCVSGKVNRADKLYLVIESVRRDTQHSPDPQLRLELTAREKRP